MDLKKILIVGSSNMDYTLYVDRFPLPGETLKGNSRFIQPGGKGANQAAAVAKSSLVEAHFITALGNDADAESIKKTLSNLGLNLHVKDSKCSTGNATIIVNSESENEITIIGGANDDLTVNDVNLNLLKESEYVVLQNEIPMDVNEFVINKAQELNTKVIYNPAPFKPVDIKLLSMVDILVVNEVEIQQYTKCDDIEIAAQKLLSSGVKNVLVTLGKDGSVCFSKESKIEVKAEKVNALDTVAAGDTYVGYFASVLACTSEIKRAMEVASKASAITVSRKGSVVSIPFYKELNIKL